MARHDTRDAPGPGNGRPTDSGALPRGLQLLTLIMEAGRPLALAEVADAAQLASSTTHRLLQSLTALGWLYRDGTGRYGIAPRAALPLPLDHPLNLLRRDGIDLLRNLQAQFSATALLSVFMGEQRVVIDAVSGPHHIAPYIATQISAPHHCSVSGKLLLSGLSDADRDRLLGPAPYAARTPRTLTTRAQLFAELKVVARTGIATNLEENLAGISAQGMRLRTPSGRTVGALTLTGQSKHFSATAMAAMREQLTLSAQLLDTSLSMRAVARFLNI
ncbi:MAG: IclR family transcriptional regulator [Xenophilus sp.]